MSFLRRNHYFENYAAWQIICVIALVDAVWIMSSDFRVDTAASSSAVVGCLATASFLWFYRSYRYDTRIAGTLSAVLLLIAFTAVAAPLSYLAASLNRPMWDSTLHQWDQALGLRWHAYLAWVNEHPRIGVAFKVSYESLIPQIILACLTLGFTGRLCHLRRFTLAMVVSGVLCIIISAAMPAHAMYVHLGLQPADFPNLSPSAAYVHLNHFAGLRDGTFRVLALDSVEGIITFPSYHAALGIILLVAFWPVPYLRWIGAVLNLTLIAATPIDGGHYFIDVVAGIIIAVLTLLAAYRLRDPCARSDDYSAPSFTLLYIRKYITEMIVE